MGEFTDSIRKSINNQNWFAALFLALCMPDICGALETPDEGNRIRYKRWFGANLAQYESGYLFSANDAWHFRCSCLHQGVDASTKMSVERIHFITPPPNQNIVHGNELDGVLQMQIDIFCKDIADAVDKWYLETARPDVDINERVEQLIKIYGPQSLEPYFVFR